ncbi:MAG: sugar phosphate isomerase/epimerase [Clostridia bacterium]|nr:sugar phosphate isomerase/epimerase [Clostridia bacterium]
MELGAQLYTVRDYGQNEKDIRRTLKKVADIGYKEVQISGFAQIDAFVMKDILDENGLKCVLTHNSDDMILNNTEKLIERHNILGCDYIGLGGMPQKYRQEYWIDNFAKDYTEAAKKIADAGKLFMYHNHDFEFQKFSDGRNMLEHLMADMPKELMGFTLDTYWVQTAGADVIEWLEILKDRIPCVHLKDRGYMPGVGGVMAPVLEGNMNFKGILAKLKELGTCKHMLVEQDTCYESPFVCLEKSFKNVKKLGY